MNVMSEMFKKTLESECSMEWLIESIVIDSKSMNQCIIVDSMNHSMKNVEKTCTISS